MAEHLAQVHEVYEAALAWIKARNSLSADCVKLGISGSITDTPKWIDELIRRERPLRNLMDKILREEAKCHANAQDALKKLNQAD
jgi:hypothetical protein